MAYVPRTPPSDPAQLPAWLAVEFEALRYAMGGAQTYLRLETLYAQPAKVFNGMVVEADGTTWNPGSGAGTYIRRAGAWVKLG